MRLFSYKIVHDTGFAPNPFWDFCTLACCKPRIRCSAQVGDWVIGIGASGSKVRGKLVFAMQVSEKLTFEQYHSDVRFARKQLQANTVPQGLLGDNIYYRDDAGNWWQQPGARHGPDQMAHDLSCPFVLVSASGYYYYFGANAMEVPAHLSDLAEVGRGHKYRFDPDLVADFLVWLEGECEPGLHGMPSNLYNLRKPAMSSPIRLKVRSFR